MKLTLTHANRDVVDVELHRGDVRLRVWRKHPEPTPAPEPDKNGGFHRGSNLADSSRAGWTPEPDTTTFGFNRGRR